MEAKHLLGPSWSTFNPQINTQVFQEQFDYCKPSFSNHHTKIPNSDLNHMVLNTPTIINI